jgi:hypothetical protein
MANLSHATTGLTLRSSRFAGPAPVLNGAARD